MGAAGAAAYRGTGSQASTAPTTATLSAVKRTGVVMSDSEKQHPASSPPNGGRDGMRKGGATFNRPAPDPTSNVPRNPPPPPPPPPDKK